MIKINSLNLTVTTVAALIAACSGTDLNDAGIAKRDQKKLESADNPKQEPKPVEASNGSPSNEYQGTAEPAVIAAAYLACGLDDTTLGCNLYNQKDQRIAAADNHGQWEAKVGDRNLIRGQGRQRVSFVADTGPLAPSDLITVTYQGPDGGFATFRGRVVTLPAIKDLALFSNASDLTHTMFAGKSQSSIVSAINGLRSSLSTGSSASPQNKNANIIGFCVPDSYHPLCVPAVGEHPAPNRDKISLGRPTVTNISNSQAELGFAFNPLLQRNDACMALGRIMKAALCN